MADDNREERKEREILRARQDKLALAGNLRAPIFPSQASTAGGRPSALGFSGGVRSRGREQSRRPSLTTARAKRRRGRTSEPTLARDATHSKCVSSASRSKSVGCLAYADAESLPILGAFSSPVALFTTFSRYFASSCLASRSPGADTWSHDAATHSEGKIDPRTRGRRAKEASLGKRGRENERTRRRRFRSRVIDASFSKPVYGAARAIFVGLRPARKADRAIHGSVLWLVAAIFQSRYRVTSRQLSQSCDIPRAVCRPPTVSVRILFIQAKQHVRTAHPPLCAADENYDDASGYNESAQDVP